METCVPVQTHALPDGRAHVLSWLRDAIRESAEYRCSVLSSVGSQTSQVRITVMRRGKQWPPTRIPTAALHMFYCVVCVSNSRLVCDISA